MIRPGIRRLVDLTLRRRELVARDVDDEIGLHLELRTARLEQEGWPPVAARTEAERRFGAPEVARRDMKRWASRRDRTIGNRELFGSVLQDVRYAARGLRRAPAFTTFAVATLALGIGANVAMYGVVDRLLLRGPEYVRDPGRVVRILRTESRPGAPDVTTSDFGYVTYAHLRDGAHDLERVAAYSTSGAPLGSGADARRIQLGYATAGFFPLLGVRAERGRFFGPDEDRTAGASQLIVLGDALWRGQFRADTAVIGSIVRVGDDPFTVIGIAPPGFTGVGLSRVDAWLPMSLQGPRVFSGDWTRTWNAQWLEVIARLKPGVSRDAATTDATAAYRRLYDGPGDATGARLWAAPIRFTDQGRESTQATVARWVFGVTLMVLVIACLNVANLLLARAVSRRAEVGVRLALGASRRRLVRLFVTESLLLTFLGGAAALAVSAGLSAFLRGTLLPNIVWPSSPLGSRLLFFALAVCVVIGVAIGLAPAAWAARRGLVEALKSGARGVGRGTPGTGAFPAILQGTLTSMLLIGAGLFVLSLLRAEHMPLGFDADRIVTVEADWVPAATPGPVDLDARRARRNDVYRRARESVLRIPGVERAALAVGSPFGYDFGLDLIVPGWDSIPKLTGGGPYISAVSSDYFVTVGTRLLRGRTFRADEGAGTERVAIVNATMAQLLWPGDDAIGHCLHIGSASAPCAQVVGVVEDARRHELREAPAMQYYIPIGQESGFGGTKLMVRVRGDVRSLLAPLTKALRAADASVSSAQAAPIADEIDPLFRPWRLGASVFSMAGVLALLVAALGLYSVLSYLVAQRTHEIGVRLALGATGRQIASLVLRRSLGLALSGVALGFVGALYVGRFVGQLLFNTSARDPGVFVTAALMLGAAGLLAGLLPALRARRVDPMRALNAE
jgi:putative ABC transport system permease protein